MSKRQTIFDLVKARMATIVTANGYTSNVGQKVFEWQLLPVSAGTPEAPSQLPCILLSDPEETAHIENENDAGYARLLTIEASLLLAETDATAAKARQALADVITAIGTDQKWSQQAMRTLPVRDELILDSEGVRISGVRITFQIKYGRAPWVA